MTRHRFRAHPACTLPAVVLAAALFCAPGGAFAQDRGGNFLGNLFNRDHSEPQHQQQGQDQDQDQPRQSTPRVAQSGGGGGDDASRIDRIENMLRQLTGSIEQLQHDNQMLQMQVKRLQDDTEYRFQQMGGRGGAAPMPPANNNVAPTGPYNAPQQNSGRRSDVYDPNQNPNAPGAPRTLGNASVAAMPPVQNPPIMNDQPIGAPGGRDAGAPLDLNTPDSQAPSSAGVPPVAPQATDAAPQSGPLPPVMGGGQRTNAPVGTQLATLPPTATSKDEYDLAYGYILRKDYGLATQAFNDFIRKYPNDKLLPEAQYWLGESQFQQQRYREAAESFLAVSTKYERSGKAPDSLLRLGQSLAALHQKEASCATLAEVGRKFPNASASVKRGVAQEQKRVHC